MKKIKGLVATLMIFTMMIGSIGIVAASNEVIQTKPINGGYTTLDDPNPIAF